MKKFTSYEIICAILRIVPNWLYLELAAHPVKIIKYTEILEIMKKIKVLKILSNTLKLANGRSGQIKRAIEKERAGEIKIRVLFIRVVRVIDLLNSLIASLKG